MLAAVADGDLAEASAINDAASRLGGPLVIAVVPALIGAGGGRAVGAALSHGYQPAMIALGGLCAAAALATGLFASDDRADAPRIAPPVPAHGCAPPADGDQDPVSADRRSVSIAAAAPPVSGR